MKKCYPFGAFPTQIGVPQSTEVYVQRVARAPKYAQAAFLNRWSKQFGGDDAPFGLRIYSLVMNKFSESLARSVKLRSTQKLLLLTDLDGHFLHECHKDGIPLHEASASYSIQMLKHNDLYSAALGGDATVVCKGPRYFVHGAAAPCNVGTPKKQFKTPCFESIIRLEWAIIHTGSTLKSVLRTPRKMTLENIRTSVFMYPSIKIAHHRWKVGLTSPICALRVNSCIDHF